MNKDLFRHWTLTDLVEGLDNDSILCEHIQVGDLEPVLMSLVLDELDGLEEVGLVVAVNGLLVADVVAQDVSVPVFP